MIVPEFTRVAQAKLDKLMLDGWQITGYSIQDKEGRKGFVTSFGFVGWWQDNNERKSND